MAAEQSQLQHQIVPDGPVMTKTTRGIAAVLRGKPGGNKSQPEPPRGNYRGPLTRDHNNVQ